MRHNRRVHVSVVCMQVLSLWVRTQGLGQTALKLHPGPGSDASQLRPKSQRGNHHPTHQAEALMHMKCLAAGQAQSRTQTQLTLLELLGWSVQMHTRGTCFRVAVGQLGQLEQQRLSLNYSTWWRGRGGGHRRATTLTFGRRPGRGELKVAPPGQRRKQRTRSSPRGCERSL